MADSKLPNRITAEELAEIRAWQIPPLADPAGAVPTAQREERQRRASDVRRSREKVEDLGVAFASRGGVTARELEDVVAAAEQDGFAEGRREGFEQGRAEGYEAGQQQGLMEMRQQLSVEQERFARMVQALQHPLEAHNSELEQMLLDIVCTLSRAVVSRELMSDSSHILQLVRQAIEALPVGRDHIKLYLNPDDLALVETYAQERQLHWQILSDDSMMPGGCKVESDLSRVDFSVENRLAGLLDQFVNKQLLDEEIYPEDDEPDISEEPDGD